VDHQTHHAAAPKARASRRNWRRIHHSPLFWIGTLLGLAAISVYVWSLDLSWRPRARSTVSSIGLSTQIGPGREVSVP